MYEKATAAMKHPDYSSITAEYKRHRGAWATSAVLLRDQVTTALDSANDPANGQVIEKAMAEIPWLSTAASAARSRYAKQAVQQQQQAKKQQNAGGSSAFASADADARKEKIRKTTEAAATKIRLEMQEKEQKAAERQRELLRECVVEYLRLQYGSKQQPATQTAQQRLAKYCRCGRTLGEGIHKDTCDLNPTRLRFVMHQSVAERAHIAKQLATRTSLTKPQQTKALDHLFGPEVFISQPSSSSQGPQPKKSKYLGQLIFQTRPPPPTPLGGPWVGGWAGLGGPI